MSCREGTEWIFTGPCAGLQAAMYLVDSEKGQAGTENQINKNNLSKQIKVITTGCFGLVPRARRRRIPEGVMYTMVRVGDVEEIVKEHFITPACKRLMAGAREAKTL